MSVNLNLSAPEITPIQINANNSPILCPRVESLEGLSWLITCLTPPENNRYHSIFYTNENGFSIKCLSKDEADTDSCLKQALARQKIRQLFSKAVTNDQEHKKVVSNFIEIERIKRGDTQTLIDRYLDSVESWIKKDTLNEEQRLVLKALFSELNECFSSQTHLEKSQKISYSKDISSKIDKATTLRNRALEKFKNLKLAEIAQNLNLTQSAVGAFRNIMPNISALAGKDHSLRMLNALAHDSNSFDLFELTNEPYFENLIQKLQQFKEFTETPAHLFEAFVKCRYINMGSLESVPIFKSSPEKLKELLNKMHLKTIKANKASQEFLDLHLKELLENHHEQISLLDLSKSKVHDQHLTSTKNFSKLNTINLQGMLITGTCLKENIFKSITKLDLSNNENLLEDNIKNLSSNNLKEIDLSSTKISGSCLKAQCFKNLEQLGLRECYNITDENLEHLSSSNLRKINLSSTKISGSCLKAQCFKNLEILYLILCRFLTDENLKHLSSNKLKEIQLTFTNINGSCLNTECFNNLKKLDLSFCSSLNDDNIKNFSSNKVKQLLVTFSNQRSLLKRPLL